MLPLQRNLDRNRLRLVTTHMQKHVRQVCDSCAKMKIACACVTEVYAWVMLGHTVPVLHEGQRSTGDSQTPS